MKARNLRVQNREGRDWRPDGRDHGLGDTAEQAKRVKPKCQNFLCKIYMDERASSSEERGRHTSKGMNKYLDARCG